MPKRMRCQETVVDLALASQIHALACTKTTRKSTQKCARKCTKKSAHESRAKNWPKNWFSGDQELIQKSAQKSTQKFTQPNFHILGIVAILGAKKFPGPTRVNFPANISGHISGQRSWGQFPSQFLGNFWANFWALFRTHVWHISGCFSGRQAGEHPGIADRFTMARHVESNWRTIAVMVWCFALNALASQIHPLSAIASK